MNLLPKSIREYLKDRHHRKIVDMVFDATRQGLIDWLSSDGTNRSNGTTFLRAGVLVDCDFSLVTDDYSDDVALIIHPKDQSPKTFYMTTDSYRLLNLLIEKSRKQPQRSLPDCKNALVPLAKAVEKC